MGGHSIKRDQCPVKGGIVLNNSFSLITDHDIYLFREGSHFHLYDKLGSHLASVDGKEEPILPFGPRMEKGSR
jgi:hypothetical protein